VYNSGLTPEAPLLIRTKAIEETLRHGRLSAKTLDNMFRRRIEKGANCSPFVSKAILAAVKEIYPVGPEVTDNQLGLGQIQPLVVAAEEPVGKEDLAFRLFNCGVRTIVRDVQLLRRRQLEVPSRGQQQDIGPGQTHRVQAVRLFLMGHQPNEIAQRMN